MSFVITYIIITIVVCLVYNFYLSKGMKDIIVGFDMAYSNDINLNRLSKRIRQLWKNVQGYI